jgi:hypothetical protein
VSESQEKFTMHYLPQGFYVIADTDPHRTIQHMNVVKVTKQDPASAHDDLYELIDRLNRMMPHNLIILDTTRGAPAWLGSVLGQFRGSGCPVALYPEPADGSDLAKIMEENGLLNGRGTSLIEAWKEGHLKDMTSNEPVLPGC